MSIHYPGPTDMTSTDASIFPALSACVLAYLLAPLLTAVRLGAWLNDARFRVTKQILEGMGHAFNVLAVILPGAFTGTFQVNDLLHGAPVGAHEVGHAGGRLLSLDCRVVDRRHAGIVLARRHCIMQAGHHWRMYRRYQ